MIPSNPAAPTTSPRVVLPFYGYGAGCFLLAALVLLLHSGNLPGHYFQPPLLAITHLLALGWGTMMTFGASYQLMPVLTGKLLWSDRLATLSFWLAGLGIPLLVWGFYSFQLGAPAQLGGVLTFGGISCWLFNMSGSVGGDWRKQVHAVFLFTAGIWLWLTAFAGLVLLFNFRYPILPADSLHYLSLHAHLGIVGWFLLLITGVGSRLIPMFLISKYENNRLLWALFGLVNGGLLVYLGGFMAGISGTIWIAILLVAAAISLFILFCYRSYQKRLRRAVDLPVRLSLFSAGLMTLPVGLLLIAVFWKSGATGGETRLFTVYGILIFLGWITALLFGMTFKTLPFIVWNKVYGKLAGKQQTPAPNALFEEKVLCWMTWGYLAGMLALLAGLFSAINGLLRLGSLLLFLSAALYCYLVSRMLTHKPPAAL